MKSGVALAVVLGAAVAAQAQYSSTFEPPVYTGSATGTPLTNGFGGPAGQDGWYNPVSGSVDFQVHTYAGNPLGFPSNPNGGTQFIGALGSASPNIIGRGQHAVDFSAGGTWTASWDVAGGFIGTAPAFDNLGSFSLQPSSGTGFANYFQQIMQWGTNTPNPVQYNINYGSFTAAGAAAGGAGILFLSPGPAWQNIPVNHWIHEEATFDFTSNQILSVTIQNLTLGTPAVTADVSAMGWYLAGGANNIQARPFPTDIRTFTGNNQNATGWDNIAIVPAPGALALLGLGGLLAGRRRR
ncbi:MAG: MYXO-CTERM sorting domain-containing protein [Phycisphaerales bacterium]